MNVKLFVTDGSVTIQTIFAASKTIFLIVSAIISDPARYGIVNLNHPGGNLTGLSNLTDELAGKRLELLKELLPEARRVAVLRDRDNINPAVMPAIDKVAKSIGVDLRVFDAAAPASWPALFVSIADYQPDALLQLTSATFASGPNEIVALAVARRVPVVYGERAFVEGRVA